jgi:hypothetical protein
VHDGKSVTTPNFLLIVCWNNFAIQLKFWLQLNWMVDGWRQRFHQVLTSVEIDMICTTFLASIKNQACLIQFDLNRHFMTVIEVKFYLVVLHYHINKKICGHEVLDTPFHKNNCELQSCSSSNINLYFSHIHFRSNLKYYVTVDN